jgi:hypothetical protein
VRDVTGTHDEVRRVCAAILAVVLAVTIGSMVTDSGEPERVIAAGAVAPGPASPLDRLRPVLRRQAAALVRGDLAGWLAAVDPALHGRYRALYRTLRALRVTTVDYRVTGGRPPAVTVELGYCFAACTGDRPRIAQALTVRPAGDTYVISGLSGPADPTPLQPTPWEAGDLVFAQGRRVTVAAPKALAGRLAEVLSVADRAAVVDDHYAALVGNRQARYRIFLATDRLWRSWYGGKATDWAVGYMQPLDAAGADVVINPGRIRGRSALREVIQHELGHVATIGGVAPGTDDMWLVEGVAEYIGAQPRRARATYSRTVLRRPTSMVARPLRDGAGPDDVAAFYAHGHFAVECLTTTFGEPRAMEFVRLRLRLGNSLDEAARSVFGQPFAAVGKTCVKWIRQQVG